MKLLAATVLLYGLWVVARCSDPGPPTSSPVDAADDPGANTTVSPVTIPSQPTLPPSNMTTAATTITTHAPTTSPAPPNTTTVTTPVPTVPVTNATVAPSTAVPPTAMPPPERHFDTLSFLGGIILTLGLLAICYVGFKFYKARTERNYHTL